MTKNKYNESVALLNAWAYAYYTLDNEIASDAMYDELYFKVKAFEEENNIVNPTSPTQRVGDQLLDGFEKGSHLVKMYSLDDVFNPPEFISWTKNILKDYPDAIFYGEPKYDGLSLNLLYNNGFLESAITRGDGLVGENVTKNAAYVQGIPLSIEYKGKVEIRGEVVILREAFEQVNESRVLAGKDVFKNERGAAAGSLRSFDSAAVKYAQLKFVPYGLGESEKVFQLQSESYNWILSQGFVNWDSNPKQYISANPEDLITAYDEIIENRDNYRMLLDGMVVKVDQKSIQDDLGFATKYPKWGIAFKFPAGEMVTTLKDVLHQVGKTGAVTPVGIVDPVVFDGITVERVSLHNYDEIARKDIRIGDKVNIIRSGDVIPKIVGVNTLDRTGDEVSIEEPSQCPVCGSDTERREIKEIKDKVVFSAVTYCSNRNCSAVIKGRIAYAVGKKALDISAFGESAVNELIEKGLVTTLSDIFTLTVEDCLTLDGFKQRKAEKLIAAIESARNTEAYRLLNALDIETIGERASQKLAHKFRERIFTNIPYEELIEMEDIGEVAANKFIIYMLENMDEVNRLLTFINPVYPAENDSDIFKDQAFVITGTLSESRKFYEDIVKNNGGKVSSSVSKKTFALLAGESAGSKLVKAEKLGITVLSEDEFLDLLK